MTEDERPLRLDVPREEALAHAARLVEEAWRSFDRFRPEEPPLDQRVRELIRAGLPEDAVKKELYWPKGKEPRGLAAADLASAIEEAEANADQ